MAAILKNKMVAIILVKGIFKPGYQVIFLNIWLFLIFDY